MTKNEVVEYIAKTGLLTEIINNIGRGELPENLQDLEQDIIEDLLKKEDKLDILVRLYGVGQLKYYLSRIVLNNIRSKNSPYYYKYKLDSYLHKYIGYECLDPADIESVNFNEERD